MECRQLDKIKINLVSFHNLLVIIYKPFPKSTKALDDNILMHV